MITTATAAFVLEEGSQQQFFGSSIICQPTYLGATQKFSVQLNILDSTTSTGIAYGYMEVTKAEVDAETGAGTGEVAQWFSALQQAVVTKLEDIPDNSSVVFGVV